MNCMELHPSQMISLYDPERSKAWKTQEKFDEPRRDYKGFEMDEQELSFAHASLSF
jgi:hypothetical protein